MPLVEPLVNGTKSALREKILLLAPGKSGKTSCWLSLGFWAWKSGDTRRFFVIDTEDAVRDVTNEPKYYGILAEDGGPVHVYNVVDWEDYIESQEKIMAEAQQGDWVCIDMISHAWPAVQQHYLREAVGAKSRGEALLTAAKSGARGWDLYREAEIEWPVVNGLYDDFIKPLLLRSPAHLFFCAEQDEIRESGKTPEADKEHLREWGKYKAAGQKKLPYQCRSYLRLQRLARGRVLYTLGDRARTELNGDTMSPDFFATYLRDVAGWSIAEPEKSSS